MKFTVVKLKHEGKERKGFVLNRPNGTKDFLFIHFKTPANLLQNDIKIQINPGACIIYTPNTRHWFEVTDCDLIHDWVHFLPENPEEFINFGLPINRIFYPPQVHFITPAIMACESEFINKELSWEEVVSATLTSFFIKLKREIIREKTLATSSYMTELHKNFKQLRLAIYGQVEEAWDIERMASELSLSRSRFSVLYKKFFGVSPKDDLIAARIARAEYLLKSSNLKISQIAEMSGYTNTYHFIRQFKKITGVSPGNARYL